MFPIEKYKIYSILSIINSKNGLNDLAQKYADLANQNADKKTSGLRHHKHLGIVEKRDSILDKLVGRFKNSG